MYNIEYISLLRSPLSLPPEAQTMAFLESCQSAQRKGLGAVHSSSQAACLPLAESAALHPAKEKKRKEKKRKNKFNLTRRKRHSP